MDYNDLNYDLLITLGLQVNNENTILEQDTYNELQLKGKLIKYNVPDDMINGFYEVQFCPGKSIMQAKYFLGYFLDKYCKETGRMCRLITEDNKLYKISLIFEDGSSLVSNIFNFNAALPYLDLIFKLDQINYDLQKYDKQVD